MGMFDVVQTWCPKCGALVEFQSKAGECRLSKYTVHDVPPEIVLDLEGQTEACDGCGYEITARSTKPYLSFD